MKEYNIEVIQLDDDNEDLNEPSIENYLFYAKNEDDALDQFHKTFSIFQRAEIRNITSKKVVPHPETGQLVTVDWRERKIAKLEEKIKKLIESKANYEEKTFHYSFKYDAFITEK